MNRKDLCDGHHGKWLVLRWEDYEVLYVSDTASDALLFLNSRGEEADGLVVEQFVKEKYIDPVPVEVRRAIEKFRPQISKPREQWLLQTLDKHYPKPPAVPKIERKK